MKTLYLVRHAKSSWDDPGLDDFERPLNKRGLRNAPEMGQRLEKAGILPDLIITSPAKRAIKTAKLFADEIEYPREQILCKQRLYHASAQTILSVVQNQDNTLKSLMLFGHNPGMNDLAEFLTGEYIYNLPTAGIFAVQFEVDQWAEAKEGKKLFFDYPKNESSPLLKG